MLTLNQVPRSFVVYLSSTEFRKTSRWRTS